MATSPLVLAMPDGRTWSFDTVQPGVTRAARNQVTDHPVEDGNTFSDHVRALPRSVRLRAGVTQTPLSDRLYDQPVGPDRFLACDAFLEEASAQRLIAVLPNGEVRDDVVLADWTSSKGAQGSRIYSIELRQIQVATTTFVVIPIEPAYLEEADAGDQALTDTSEEELDAETGEVNGEEGSTLYEWLYGDDQAEG